MPRPDRKRWSDTSAWSARRRDTQTEGFWASYSDLMAGILMIFVLVYMVHQNATLESTEAIRNFTTAMNNICTTLEPDIETNPNIEMNCHTGAITFVTATFGFSDCELAPAVKEDLRAIVPRWLDALDAPEIRGQVEYIEIGGYTDKQILKGGDLIMGNVEVSKCRATNVLEFLLKDPSSNLSASQQERLRAQGVVVAYASHDFPDTCELDRCPEARRIIIKANVNEATVLRQLIETVRRRS